MIDKLVRQLIAQTVRYRTILIWLLILVLFGYTLLKIRAISNPQPDPAYVNSKGQTNQPTKIQIKDSLKQQIENLQETPVNVAPRQVGKPDPFNP